MCLVGNKRADIARVIPCKNNFCTKFAHRFHFCGLQKLNTLNLLLFHPPLNPCNHFPTVLIKTNWYTISYKFVNCSNLANVTLSSNITSIGSSAFSDCKSLKNLTISKDVTSIKDIRFNNDYEDLELESVYVAWQNPIEAGSFFNRIKISNCTLYVPQGTKEAYANADVWKDFGNIIEYDATGIDKVTNRSDVKEISRYSLNGQRVTSPTKGVNIVVYSDGSIKKVAVQ